MESNTLEKDVGLILGELRWMGPKLEKMEKKLDIVHDAHITAKAKIGVWIAILTIVTNVLVYSIPRLFESQPARSDSRVQVQLRGSAKENH